MKFWEALRESSERRAWIARAPYAGHGRPGWLRYAYRWDRSCNKWQAKVQVRPGDPWNSQWERDTLPLGEQLMTWDWEIVEVVSS